MIYGTPTIIIEDDHTDQVGMRTLILSLMWQVSRWPMDLDQLDAEKPVAPEVPGGMWLIGSQTRRQGGALRTHWHYEGINGDGKSVTFKTRGNSPHYGFEPGFAELPIQQNSKISKLLDEFAGQPVDNQIFWPLELPETSTGQGGLSGGSTRIGFGSGGTTEGSKKINPMFGRQSYFALQGGTYWYRYMATDERSIPHIEGKVFKATSLPGRARNVPGRDYLGVGAPYIRRGPAAIEVVEQYWLSDEGGWPKEIYGA